MFHRAGARFFIIAALVLLMGIPLLLVSGVVDGRLSKAREAQNSVAAEWAGAQIIDGPRILVPVTARITEVTAPNQSDDDPTSTRTSREVPAEALVLLPEDFAITVSNESEIRKRGIFDIPVYTSKITAEAHFAIPDIADQLQPNEVAQWERARLIVALRHNKGLQSEAQIAHGDKPLALEPLEATHRMEGIGAAIGDPRNTDLRFNIDLTLRGSESVTVTPVGRISKITIDGNWPDPAFQGVLPAQSDVTPEGFSAEWVIPHLARTIPQIMRSNPQVMFDLDYDRFSGVRFLQPNDFYRHAFRATRYAILMIAMTFLTVFLVEDRRNRPAHPVQYVLIGLAQTLFVLLMVAYAEHFGFGRAFLGASVATIALLALFGAVALRLGRRNWVMVVLLAVLYAVLWLILKSADYALLAGATLAFVALAATMITTRNENWYGPAKSDAAPAKKTAKS